MKKKHWGPALGLGLVLGLLLLLLGLVLAERGAPGASITDLPTALWFALTTLTTVGYGDAYPVTPLGRVLGVLLQLGSLGLLGALVGGLYALLRGAALPRLRLRLRRGRDWYVFSEPSAPALRLAAALRREDPRRVLLFSCPPGTETPELGLALPLSPREILSERPEPRGALLFCMGADSGENEALARSLRPLAETVYCMSSLPPAQPVEGLRFFDPAECRARLYWSRHPLENPRATVVLLGRGPTAEALLEQALLVNVLEEPQRLRYHLFGDWSDFRLRRRFLDKIAPGGAMGDALIFHEEPWTACPELLLRADRLILCGEREAEVRETLRLLGRTLPLTAPVHARLSPPEEGAVLFGGDEEIFTPELVLLSRLQRLGRALHNIYRSSAGAAVPPWEDLGDFARRSNLASADHLSVKLGILLGETAPQPEAELCRRGLAAFLDAPPRERERFRRIEHSRWCRFHWLHNWQYAPARDNERRLHPLLLPYEELSPADQAKDDYSWLLLGDLAKELDAEGEAHGKR